MGKDVRKWLVQKNEGYISKSTSLNIYSYFFNVYIVDHVVPRWEDIWIKEGVIEQV